MTFALRKFIWLAKRIGVALFAMFFVFSGTSAIAGDYTVTYGFDDPEYSEAGKLDCTYDKECDLKLKNGNIALALDFSDPRHRVVIITIYQTNWGPGCCYFNGGLSRVRADPGSRVALNVFFGRARRGLEYVESNIRFGTLDLLFSKTK
jgi:hypothetical protein